MQHPFTGKRHALPLALLCAVLATPILIVGCGGGNDGPGTTTAGTTTAGTTTAGTTTAGTTTAGTTTAGGTTAGGTTGPSACTNEPANLTFSNFNNYNGSEVNTTCGTAFATRLFGAPNSLSAVSSLFENIGSTGVAERRFNVVIDNSPIVKDAQYNLATVSSSQVKVQYLERANGSDTFKVWTANAGTLTLQNVSGPIVINLENGSFSATSGGATGSFNLAGTVNFNKQF